MSVVCIEDLKQAKGRFKKTYLMKKLQKTNINNLIQKQKIHKGQEKDAYPKTEWNIY